MLYVEAVLTWIVDENVMSLLPSLLPYFPLHLVCAVELSLLF
jgi:hypothetical protein